LCCSAGPESLARVLNLVDEYLVKMEVQDSDFPPNWTNAEKIAATVNMAKEFFGIQEITTGKRKRDDEPNVTSLVELQRIQQTEKDLSNLKKEELKILASSENEELVSRHLNKKLKRCFSEQDLGVIQLPNVNVINKQ